MKTDQPVPDLPSGVLRVPGALRQTVVRVASAGAAVQVLSFGSSIALATQLGPSAGTDAYYLALAVPALVYAVLLAAIRLGGVPMLTEVKHRESPNRLSHAASELATGTVVVAAALSVLAIAVMAVALPAAAGATPRVSALTQLFIIELLPYAVSGALLGVLGAVLAVQGSFAVATLVAGIEPVLKTILLILYHRQLGAQALIIGNVAGNLLAALVLWIQLRRLGVDIVPARFRSSPLVRNTLRVSAPLLISQSVLQVNPLIDRTLAAGLGTGTVTVFQLGVGLFTAPATVIATSVAAPLTATWSARLAAGRWDSVIGSFDRVVVTIVTALPPLVVLGVLLRGQIVGLAYSSHVYSPAAVRLTADVFAWLALGLVSQILIGPLATLFVINRQTVFPMLIGIANGVLNAGLDLLLRGPLGVGGIALSTTLTLVVLCCAYFYEANRRWGLGSAWASVRRRLLPVAVASLGTGLGGAVVLHLTHASGSRFGDAILIVLVGAAGSTCTVVVFWLSGVLPGSLRRSV